MTEEEINRKFPGYKPYDVPPEQPDETDEPETPDETEETYWTWWLTFHA